MPQLVLIRHAKSDWSGDDSDLARPLAPRGRRQAPAIGRWLAAQDRAPDLVLLSPARRARQTWQLVADAMPESDGEVVVAEAAYTFDGRDLLALVRGLPAGLGTIVLVGHNPAMEELVAVLTGADVHLPTSAIAVVDLPDPATAGDGRARLLTTGRPADGLPPLD